MNYCEECEIETESYNVHYGAKFYLCDPCNEYMFCECGQRLEDSYGSPGDGFCKKCQ